MTTETIHRYKCGCKLVACGCDDGLKCPTRGVQLQECPLHTNAQKMRKLLTVLLDHASETYPHFESERGQKEIAAGRKLLARTEKKKRGS